MKGSLDLEGFAEVDNALGELSKATGKNVLRRVGRQALTPMMEEAISLAPDDPSTPPPNDLKSSFAISERRRASRWSGFTLRENFIELFMGPTRAGYPQAMVQEFGAEPHFVSKNAGRKKVRATLVEAGRKMHPGHAPSPYMRPAWDRLWRPMLDALKGLLWVEIERARQRAARRQARLIAKLGARPE